MVPFSYIKAVDPSQAITERGQDPHATYLGGGTNLLDHLKLGVENPERLIDVRRIGLGTIEYVTGDGLRIGASVTNSALAYDPQVQSKYPVLSEAILSGASPQLRNVATTAGNLLQKTRCYYFRDVNSPCNKREPGSGCAAIGGLTRMHAILGTSEKCIATHPSDMDVALMALDAVVRIRGVGGDRTVPIEDFYVPYGEDPAKENILEPGDLVMGVDIPGIKWFARSHYVKARDRASYEFALASAAVALDLHEGKVRDCRIALGGVGTKPWRAKLAEAALRSKLAEDAAFARAADAELAAAKPQPDNAFKVELCKRVLVSALRSAREMRIDA